MTWIDNIEKIIDPLGDLVLDRCPFCGRNDAKYIKYHHPAGTRYAAGCFRS